MTELSSGASMTNMADNSNNDGLGNKRHFNIFSPYNGSTASDTSEEPLSESNNKCARTLLSPFSSSSPSLSTPSNRRNSSVTTPRIDTTSSIRHNGDFELNPLPSLSGGYDRTNDEVHSTIYISPALKVLMGTRVAQRLRHLSQLGVTEHVYVNATHNRFEHSLGVSHLASKLCRRIQRTQPNLGITAKDELCIVIAGFCHDLGHGPFSHVFDGVFQKQMLKENKGAMKEWKHEDASLMMLHLMLREIGLAVDVDHLDKPLKQIGAGIGAHCFGVYYHTAPLPAENILTSRDLVFVQECIVGRPILSSQAEFVGRPWEKHFLYDIINNTHSGLDVDKMDYYARDMKRTLGGSGSKAQDLFLEEALVAQSNPCGNPKCFRCKNHCVSLNENDELVLMICYPVKLVVTAMEFFRTRFRLHTDVYTHKTVKAVEFMVCDVLAMADPYIRLPDRYGDFTIPIHKAMTVPEAYLHLTDAIIEVIALKDDAHLSHSRNLIRRMKTRDLYKCVCSERLCSKTDRKRHKAGLWDMKADNIQQRLFEIRDELLRQKDASSVVLEQDPNGNNALQDFESFDENDMVVEVRELHYGMKAENPVMYMRFVSKQQTKTAALRADAHDLPLAQQVHEDIYECHIPRAFLEKSIRVFNRSLSNNKGHSMDLCVQMLLENERNSSARSSTLSQR